MKVVFFGTPQFAADVLRYLLDNKVEIVAVVTRPDKPKGRSGKALPTPVKEVAAEYSPALPVYQPVKASSDAFREVLNDLHADLFVVVAYGEIVKQHLLDIPPLGCINLHASLLPKYRGAAPIQCAVMEGETETGVTIMYMVLKMDAGAMIRTVKVPIGPDDTFGAVEARLRQEGARLLLEVIKDFEQGKVQAVPQDEQGVTYAAKIELEDCQIDWGRPAAEIHNLVRGVDPYPGAWCFVMANDQVKRLKVKDTRLIKDETGVPATILSCGTDGLKVACGEGALLIKTVQLEGKKAMPPDQLYRGTPFRFLDAEMKPV